MMPHPVAMEVAVMERADGTVYSSLTLRPSVREEEQKNQSARMMSTQVARPYYYLGGNRALTQLSTGQPFL
jgi:hypothetical protein